MPASDTDGPIHTYFGLSYTTHLVLDRTATAHLDASWHLQMSLLLGQLMRAFAHIPQADQSIAVKSRQYALEELTDDERERFGVTYDPDLEWLEPEDLMAPDVPTGPYRYREDFHLGWERFAFPAEETREQAAKADRIVLNRTLLQSMPRRWQSDFVELARQMTDPSTYDLIFLDERGREIEDPIPGYGRGRTYLEPHLEDLA